MLTWEPRSPEEPQSAAAVEQQRQSEGPRRGVLNLPTAEDPQPPGRRRIHAGRPGHTGGAAIRAALAALDEALITSNTARAWEARAILAKELEQHGSL